MRIMIDTRWIFKNLSGIGRYTLNLTKALVQENSDNEYYFIFNSQERLDYFKQYLNDENRSNFQLIYFPFSVFSLLSQIKLPLLIKRKSIDVFHSPNFMIPLFASCKLITTIHDLIPLKHPEFAPKSLKSRFYFIYSLLQKYIAKRCNRIITDSNHSKEDIVNLLKVDPSMVKVIYLDLDENFAKNGEKIPSVVKSIEGKKYFLYTGRQDPYKNISGLLRIFKKVVEKIEYSIHLIISGCEDPRYPQYKTWVWNNGMQNVVHFSGYVEDKELSWLYKNATIYLLPSLYEGFGLTALEAQACGAPVIASNVASLPEVLGLGACLLDPYDEQKWVEEIIEVLKDFEYRNQLVQRGYANRKRFLWQKTAKETKNVYLTVKQ